MTSERTPWRYIQVYKYRWAGRLCRSLTPRAWRDYKPLEARRIRLIHCLGEGVGKEFCCNKGALRWSPLKAYSVVLTPSPHTGGERFHDPPSSIPATTKSQCNYMQASDIDINTHVLWTLNNNFTYLVIWYEQNCLWRVTLLIQIVENKFIVALVLLTVEFLFIFFIPWFPVTFIFGTPRLIRLCSQTLWCVGNNDIE